MAITGTLLADFTSFYDASAKAETSLKSLDRTANQTGRMLDDMADEFDAGPIVSEADQAERALESMGTTASETTGPALERLGEATADAGDDAMTFKQSFDQVDKVLGSVGINLGPIPGAISELGAAAGKSASQLGLLATAGLTVGAAIGGWKLGRWFAGLTDLDDKIAGFIPKLEGFGLVIHNWGDVAKEEAAAGAETLARASALAGREITNMDQAIRILQDSSKKTTAELKDTSDELARGKAEAEKFADFTAKLFSRDDLTRANDYAVALGGVENVSKLTTEKKKELNKAVADGIAAYKALGETAPASLEAIHRATTELIPITESFSAANSRMWVQFAAGVDDGKKKMAEIAERSKLHWEDIGGVSREMLQKVADEAKEKYELAMKHSDHFTGQQIANFRTAAVEAAKAVELWGTDTIEAYDEIAAKSTEVADTQIANTERAAAAATLSWSEAMDAVRAGQGAMTGTIPALTDFSPQRKADIQKAYDEHRYFGPVKMGMFGMAPDWDALGFKAAGGPVMGGNPYVVGEKGPELFVPSSSGMVKPNVGAGMNVTINVNGTVLGNRQEIARVVGEALMSSLKGAGVRLPVGA